MKIIACKPHHLQQRLSERGKSWASAEPAIFAQLDDLLMVDVEHAAYPKQHDQPKPSAQVIEPVPRDQWPRWVRVVWLLSNESDTGAGDTVQRWAAKFGGEQFKRWAETVGLPCACTSRQAEWNQTYPYRN